MVSQSTKWYRAHPGRKAEVDRRYRERHKEELREKSKIRYQNNRDEYLAKGHKNYLEHREERLVQNREYRKNNPEKVRVAWDKWENEHPDRMKESKEARDNDPIRQEKRKAYAHQYYLDNRDKIIERSCDWWANRTPKQRKEHNELVMRRYHRDDKWRLRLRIRDAWQRAGGNFTRDEWIEVLEEYDYRCAYCGSKEDITIDHAIPISKGGLNIKSNIVPACHKCNSKKKDRTPEEFKKACAKWLANRHYQEVMKLEFN
jgi:5-methylcytosine-specific restriction endonuclease McrA